MLGSPMPKAIGSCIKLQQEAATTNACTGNGSCRFGAAQQAVDMRPALHTYPELACLQRCILRDSFVV